MDFRYTTQDGLNKPIEGAVISHTELNDHGATVYLMDGRCLVFADCEGYAVVFTRDLVQ